MTLFKSIRWRLQLWYGLVLLGVLAGFGITAYQLQWGRQMRRVDDELHRRFVVVAEATHPHPPGPNGREMPMNGFPGPPRDEFGGQGQRDEFHLPPEAAELFDTNDPDGFYFVIVSRDNKEIARAGNVPASPERYVPLLPDMARINQPPEGLKNSNPPPVFTQNGFRQMADMTPAGDTIRVGCPITPELQELHRTAWELTGIGGVILFFGLAGGWWISSRAIKPVENINAAALKISAGDLSQRINVAETESELGQLAATLNATFGRLQAAFELQKQFASDAAHELRTPVSVILTQTQTALKRPREAADYQETVEACQRAAQRMKKMISALLELARLDAGQEQMQRLPFDFSQTVREGIEAIQPLAVEKHVQVVSELAPVRIVGDTGRLGQMVSNLLTNAIQYNHEGGEVRVKLERRDGFAVLTVSDNGLGIASEDIPHIFERFYRGDKSRSGMNAGLGLAICQAIVVSHGGAIEADGAEGKGATFTVRLPLA